MHSKAGHSALACFRCGGSEIDPDQWKLAEKVLALLEEGERVEGFVGEPDMVGERCWLDHDHPMSARYVEDCAPMRATLILHPTEEGHDD